MGSREQRVSPVIPRRNGGTLLLSRGCGAIFCRVAGHLRCGCCLRQEKRRRLSRSSSLVWEEAAAAGRDGRFPPRTAHICRLGRSRDAAEVLSMWSSRSHSGPAKVVVLLCLPLSESALLRLSSLPFAGRYDCQDRGDWAFTWPTTTPFLPPSPGQTLDGILCDEYAEGGLGEGMCDLDYGLAVWSAEWMSASDACPRSCRQCCSLFCKQKGGWFDSSSNYIPGVDGCEAACLSFHPNARDPFYSYLLFAEDQDSVYRQLRPAESCEPLPSATNLPWCMQTRHGHDPSPPP